MKINALCTANFDWAKRSSDKVFFCGDSVPCNAETVYYSLDKPNDGMGVFVDDLMADGAVDGLCEVLDSNPYLKAIVRCAYDLNEVGFFDVKFKLSPVMLLHKLGIIHQCTIASGVCLDNDDLDLMAQEQVPLIVLPTADAGYGHGYAPVCAAIHRGVKVGLGTYDGKYNLHADLKKEIHFLALTANAEMRKEDALTPTELNNILAFK